MGCLCDVSSRLFGPISWDCCFFPFVCQTFICLMFMFWSYPVYDHYRCPAADHLMQCCCRPHPLHHHPRHCSLQMWVYVVLRFCVLCICRFFFFFVFVWGFFCLTRCLFDFVGRKRDENGSVVFSNKVYENFSLAMTRQNTQSDDKPQPEECIYEN